MELLLVEDDRLQAALYERVFAQVVDVVRVVESVAAATRLLARATADSVADIVVIDVLLADGSGFDVLDALRSRPEHAAVPVVAWSATVLPDDVERGRDDDRCLVVQKPNGLEELRAFASEIATAGELAAGATASTPFRFDDLDFGRGSPACC
ncbi:MAG: response regulator [Actinomycetota bacterium]